MGVEVSLLETRRRRPEALSGPAERSGVLAAHQGGVPVGGPALVHDLGETLGRVVVGFLPHHGKDVPLPVLERRVLDEEQHDVTLRDEDLRIFLLGLLRRVPPVQLGYSCRTLVPLLSVLPYSGRHPLPGEVQGLHVYEVVEREAAVDESVDRLQPLLAYVAAGGGEGRATTSFIIFFFFF